MTERSAQGEDAQVCCRDCKFRRFATMECHRHAPSMSPQGMAAWPVIEDEDNWCGDFELFPYNTAEEK